MSISTSELFAVFGRIGFLSFGGPAAQISLMHRELVETRNWLTEEQFLRALSFCMLLPGPEAMQLATYAGWRLRGTLGGLIAGLLFVLPGAFVILFLALTYAQFGALPWMQALFLGVKAAVVVIVIEALLKLSKRALQTWLHWVLAIAGFAAIYLFAVPFPLLILAAGVIGALSIPNGIASEQVPLPKGNTLRTVTVWAAIWFTPLAVIYALDPDFLGPLSLFFSKLAVVTFGGAYAVLAYMTQTVVQDFGWLTTAQMMDALGLAETTPGPLILVTEFVGLLAGYAQGGIWMALAAGITTLWMTFVPCFLWIFAGAPYIEWLSSKPKLAAALQGITASVVGVIASLGLWFAMHLFFADVSTVSAGPLTVEIPRPASLREMPLILAFFAAGLLLWRHWSIAATLALCAAVSLVAHLL